MITVNSDKLRYNGVEIRGTAGLRIPRGLTAVVGANGSGKSSLARILESGWNYMTNDISGDPDRKTRVRILAFSDIHSLAGFKTEYYQQRYESTMNDETPTVRDLLGTRVDGDIWRSMAPALGIDRVVDRRLNFLSSGELRKLLIVNALFDLPDLLVLDNPYIGLDAGSRTAVSRALSSVCSSGTDVMVLVCDPQDIPADADAVVAMRDMCVVNGTDGLFPDRIDVEAVRRLLAREAPRAGAPVVEMRGCQVRYGSHVLVSGVDWTVRQGEFWALSGPNGSGKSTLLSLVNADNPQAYSNDISLFGRRRGTGESIWDIKERIGFLSSELHLYFNRSTDTLRQVVGGGFSSFARASSDAAGTDIDAWLEAFGLSSLSGHRYNTLSFGEQRLALFVRALVKRPDLLILDEPMHGIDLAAKQAVRRITEAVHDAGITVIFVTHCPSELPGCVTHRKQL